MARARPGLPSVSRPVQVRPFNDPTIATANAKKEAERFRDMMRRSREAGGHDADTSKRGKCRCGVCGNNRG
jgi:hypothetical protein